MRATSSRMMGLEPLSPAPAVPDSFAEFGGGLWTRICPLGVWHFTDCVVSCRAMGAKAMGLGCWHLIATLLLGAVGGGGEGWEHGVQKEGLGVLLVAPPSNSWSDKGSTDGN